MVCLKGAGQVASNENPKRLVIKGNLPRAAISLGGAHTGPNPTEARMQTFCYRNSPKASRSGQAIGRKCP